MGNSYSTRWPLNLCLNSSRTSLQSEDENNPSKDMTEFAVIPASDKHTATVSD